MRNTLSSRIPHSILTIEKKKLELAIQGEKILGALNRIQILSSFQEILSSQTTKMMPKMSTTDGETGLIKPFFPIQGIMKRRDSLKKMDVKFYKNLIPFHM